MIKEKIIFITGGAGFIGSNFVKYLLDKGGFEITVYDNLSIGSKKNLNKAIRSSKQIGKINFIEGDILDFKKLEKSIKGNEAVIHLAAHTGVVESIENPNESFSVNSVGTFNVLEASRMNGIKTFIFASSNASVGEQNPPIHEDMIPLPLSPYGASKLNGEALCSAYYNSYGLKTIVLRFANVYGPFSNHKCSVITRFIKRSKSGKQLEIYGDGKQTRDFIHVLDICQALVISIVLKLNIKNRNYIFQIGSGKETRIIDIANMIKEFNKNENKSKLEITFKNVRKGEIQRNFSNISKAQNILNFKPKIKLMDGLRNLWINCEI